MKKTYAVMLLLGLAGMIFAGDLVIKNGQIFRNYSIMGAAPTGIRVFFNNGEGDREIILPVDQFPDELQETVKRFARKTQEAKQAELEQQKQEKAEKDKRAKRTKAAAERSKKVAELIKKQQEADKKLQEKVSKSTPKAKSGFKSK